VFCPNCGTQNDSAATPCKKCGFKLSGISMPKFKGTMMLNSDQTVQERIEEHRRKQAPGGAAEKSKGQASEPAPQKVPGSSAPPSSLSSPRGPVLQPPRLAGSATRGRMGGTMMGVAPQGGALLPPRSVGHARPVPRDAGRPEEAAEARAESDVAPIAALASEAAVEGAPGPSPGDAGPADALAGTLAMPSIAPAPEAVFEPVGVSSRSESDRQVARTQPLAAVPTPDEPPTSDAGGVEPIETGKEAAADPELRAADTQPPRNRAVAATAALPRPSEASVASPTVPSEPVPAGIRPLDVVLIVCTLGVYGVVLWFRQRKRPA
jgi:hypothetical protein